jgi:hypothetical protein
MNTGIKDLKVLLSSMKAKLSDERYIFCTLQQQVIVQSIIDLNPIGIFKEKEGISLIITKEIAEQNNIKFDSIFRLISLQVYSSLDAVGLTAAIATKLVSSRISANIVAAYYHDHIFVPEENATKALSLVEELQVESGGY